MRVVTFNVWNQEGHADRGAIINRELRRLDPDLVALQEVVRTPERDQLSSLVEGLGFFWTHQADLTANPLPAAERYGGTVIGTRWPHRIVEVLDMRLADALDTPWARLRRRSRFRTSVTFFSSQRRSPGISPQKRRVSDR